MRATLTAGVLAGLVLAGCSSAEEPGVDVFTASGSALEPTIAVDPFREDAVTLDACDMPSLGLVEVAGSIDLGPTGVTADGPADAELVVEVTLGDTVVAGAISGTIERSGTFAATYPLEELHGETAAAVVESRVDDPQFAPACRARLLTPRVHFRPANEVPLVPADGLELREP